MNIVKYMLKGNKFSAYTDGGCSPNPGRGAYAFIILDEYNKEVYSETGTYRKTTNNRMELLGIIHCMDVLPNGSEITVYTDSTYAMYGDKKNLDNWITYKAKQNQDLWKRFSKLKNKKSLKLSFVKVRAHSNDILNNKVDKMIKNELENPKGIDSLVDREYERSLDDNHIIKSQNIDNFWEVDDVSDDDDNKNKPSTDITDKRPNIIVHRKISEKVCLCCKKPLINEILGHNHNTFCLKCLLIK